MLGIDPELIVAILAALLAISEVLVYIPKLGANSVFQLIVSGLKSLKKLVSSK